MKFFQFITSIFLSSIVPSSNSSDCSEREFGHYNPKVDEKKAIESNGYEPGLRTKKAVEAVKGRPLKPGFYFVRKKGSRTVWVEKRDGNGRTTFSTQPGAEIIKHSKKRKHHKHHRSSDRTPTNYLYGHPSEVHTKSLRMAAEYIPYQRSEATTRSQSIAPGYDPDQLFRSASAPSEFLVATSSSAHSDQMTSISRRWRNGHPPGRDY
ncbi:hypothetical protein TruAng_001216 [Truncatella angustata]|nr:hypothetical protein TruAng_001216 [Truncatella angustata]